MGVTGIVAGHDAFRQYGQRVPFAFDYTQGNWSSNTNSAWTMNVPSPGTFPTLDGAPRICTSATPGALPIQAPAAGKSLYLVGADILVPSTSTVMTLILYDRICDIQATEGSAPFSSGVLDATSEIAAGESCVCITEVSAVTTTSLYTIQYNYTNQAGASKSSIMPSPMSTSGTGQVVGGLLGYFDGVGTNFDLPWSPLAGGDQGMRTLTSITTTGSITSPGALTYVLGRVLATFDIPTIGIPESVDLMSQTATPMKVRDDACLSFLVVNQSVLNDGLWSGYLNFLSA